MQLQVCTPLAQPRLPRQPQSCSSARQTRLSTGNMPQMHVCLPVTARQGVPTVVVQTQRWEALRKTEHTSGHAQSCGSCASLTESSKVVDILEWQEPTPQTLC